MSDVEGDETMEAVVEAVIAAVGAAPTGDLGGCLDFETALIEVVKSALKTVKHLDKRQAENCDQAAYKKLVHALCQEHQIPLLTVANNLQMDKYTGLCKLYAVCVVIRDCDKEDFLNEQIKPQQA